jgi:hypothetical protein
MNDFMDLFRQVKYILRDRLAPLGYVLSKELDDPDAFGSRLVHYQFGNKLFLFIWDGRDGNLTLRFCKDISQYDYYQDWKDICTMHYDIHDKAGQADAKILETMEVTLDKFLHLLLTQDG